MEVSEEKETETMELVRQLLAPFGVECAAAAPFEALPPLFPVRSKGRVPKEARSVIFCLFPYYIGPAEPRNISRYTVVPDYHTVCREILAQVTAGLQERYPENAFAWFVDSSPIHEVEGARLAGLGVVGLNGQLIHPKYGSYCFIGEIVTDRVVEYGAPLEGGCLGCGRCLKVCPTGALTPQGVNKDICRSNITQKKGELTEWEREQIRQGGMVWGCDRCTDCCPHNAHPVLTPIAGFYHQTLTIITRDNLDMAMTDRALNYRGKAVLERNLSIVEGPAPQVSGPSNTDRSIN